MDQTIEYLKGMNVVVNIYNSSVITVSTRTYYYAPCTDIYFDYGIIKSWHPPGFFNRKPFSNVDDIVEYCIIHMSKDKL